MTLLVHSAFTRSIVSDYKAFMERIFIVQESAGQKSEETPLRYLHIATSGVVPAARLMFPEILLEYVALVSYWVKLRCIPITI